MRAEIVLEGFILIVVHKNIDFEEFVSALRDTIHDHADFTDSVRLFLLQQTPLKQAVIDVNQDLQAAA